MRPFILLLTFTLFTTICSAQEKPLTKEEAINFARWLESAIANKQQEAIKNLMDPTVFADRVVKHMKQKVSPAFIRGVSDGLQENFGMELINSAHSENGSYEFVKLYEKDKVFHLIFRLYADDGLSYHDFELTRRGDKIATADVFLYSTGDDMSKTVAEFAAYTNVENEDSEVKIKDLEQMIKVKQLLAEDKVKEAKDLFDKLPAALRNQKGSQIFYLSICSATSDDLYTKALDEFETLYRNEPNLFLSLFDLYLMRKQYDRALIAINKIDSMINKDPFLDFYRGVLYNYLDKKEDARKALSSFYKFKPDFELGLQQLILLHLDLGDYEAAKPLVAAYRSNKKFDQKQLDEDLKSYPEFGKK